MHLNLLFIDVFIIGYLKSYYIVNLFIVSPSHIITSVCSYYSSLKLEYISCINPTQCTQFSFFYVTVFSVQRLFELMLAICEYLMK